MYGHEKENKSAVYAISNTISHRSIRCIHHTIHSELIRTIIVNSIKHQCLRIAVVKTTRYAFIGQDTLYNANLSSEKGFLKCLDQYQHYTFQHFMS